MHRVSAALLLLLPATLLPPASGGVPCSLGDSQGDCEALMAMYSAFGQKPTAWATGIQLTKRVCAWDPYNYNTEAGTIECDPTGSRITGLYFAAAKLKARAMPFPRIHTSAAPAHVVPKLPRHTGVTTTNPSAPPHLFCSQTLLAARCAAAGRSGWRHEKHNASTR